jgi:sugar phosphate permease
LKKKFRKRFFAVWNICVQAGGTVIAAHATNLLERV